MVYNIHNTHNVKFYDFVAKKNKLNIIMVANSSSCVYFSSAYLYTESQFIRL